MKMDMLGRVTTQGAGSPAVAGRPDKTPAPAPRVAQAAAGYQAVAGAVADGAPVWRSIALAALLPATAAGLACYALGRSVADWPYAVLTGLALLAATTWLAARVATRIARPLELLSGHAQALAIRFCGAASGTARAETRTLALALDAVADALLRNAERSEDARRAEAQNAIDLQRQYALMQLLRGLASSANQAENLERALQEALREICAYLDWPLGRLVMVGRDRARKVGALRAHWHAPERARFAAFIEARIEVRSEVEGPGLIGRAAETNLSHWVTDLGRLEGWARHEAALAAGLRSGFVIPVTAAENEMAFLEFYSDHRIEAGDEMLELVDAIGVELWRTAARFHGEAVLQRTAERARALSAVAESMEGAVALTARDGRIEWVNQGWTRLLGTSTAQSSVDKDAPDLLFGPGSASATDCRRELAGGRRVTGLVLAAPAPAGGARWYELEIEPMPEQVAGMPASCLIVRDISGERATQIALSEALECARQASQSKSQFLANMSHEIRTPMNGVLGMAELLLGTELDERQRRFIESLYRSGEALLDIINDILDFSKIEAGKLELESIDFDLRTLVEDLIELLAPRAHQKRLELAYKLSPGLPLAVRGDPTRLRQILINIIGNAIKFTERGEVVLLVDALPADPADGAASCTRVRFEVRDSGIGMRPEAVERLFSVFMQADQSSSRRYGGTGLGLAICRQLTQLMGGSIRATSQIGEGSVFLVELPLAHGDSAAVPARPAGAEALAGKRVLIAEDNPTNRRILSEQLGALEMECAVAENGRQALQMLRIAAHSSSPFDVAVIDMKMPIMDGLALAERVRADEALRALPMLMLTSLSGREEARRAQDLGVDAYLSKPVRQQELVAALAAVLDSRPEPERAAPARSPLEGLGGRRILVVEDNAVNQEVVRSMLATFGCESVLAADGMAALDLLERERFDAVLMDCQMPVLDGFEAMRRLLDPDYREHDLARARRVPVIALTANALSGDAERCRAAGFCDYLAKPFRQRDLGETLLRWTGREAPAAGAAPARLAQSAAQPAAPPAVAAPVAVALPVAEATQAAADDVLDMHVIDEIRAMERKGARDLLRRLIKTYAGSSRALVEAAETAFAAADAAAVTQAVHTLKSSSANLGAVRFARACGEIEALARQDRLAEAQPRWQALRPGYEPVLRALDALLPDGASGGGAAPLVEAAR